MLAEEFSELFEKYINQLIGELSSYKDEKNLWKLDGEIKNTAGNLALHLTGNLNYMIGAILGNTGYVRNRDAEFADKDVPRGKLISDLQQTAAVVKSVVSKLTDENFNDIYPLEFQKRSDRRVLYIMNFIIAHFNYHLGQINYHRRLLDK